MTEGDIDSALLVQPNNNNRNNDIVMPEDKESLARTGVDIAQENMSQIAEGNNNNGASASSDGNKAKNLSLKNGDDV